MNNIKKGVIVFGFKVLKKEILKNQDIIYYELEHLKTGAKYIHLESLDKENTFCVAFKTLPEDSTGVAHILEHTVLTGSQKYPVKDPFFSMIKRSLNTFMNAFTSCDWTAYPFSTQNKKDFYNLMSVYLDATFFPELSELSFMQEGCRLEFEGDELVYKGVVYNEMKGSMSSPDRVMEQSIMSTLYPNSTYRFNSGGDPKIIPKLTYKKLKEFHQRFYHPSNARFYSYGSFPLLRHLKFIDKEILSKFKKINPRTRIKQESKWNKTREATFQYSISKADKKEKKYQIGMSWMMAPAKNSYEILILEILEYILLGSQASPLRMALLSSGIGSDLSDGSGFDSENRNTMFSLGLKDVRKEDKIKIKKIIINTLKILSSKGIDEKLVRAAIGKQEFSKRERSNSPYPYGLSLYLKIISNWLHDGKPIEVLRYEKLLKKLKTDLKSKRFLEKQIEKYFINNNNRALIILEPSDSLQVIAEKFEEQELMQKRQKLLKNDLLKINKMSADLKKRQETEDDINVLPTLELSDISPGIVSVKSQAMKNHQNVYLYKQSANGLFYISASFDLKELDEKLIFLVPFFCYAIARMGTRLKSYEDFAREFDLVSGGISFSASVQTKQDKTKGLTSFMFLSAKCLEKDIKKMMKLIKELLTDYSFKDKKRLENLTREYLARFEGDIVQNGHQYSSLLANRGFSKVHQINEMWHGVSQYKFFKKYIKQSGRDFVKKLEENLSYLAKEVFEKDKIKIALIGASSSLKQGSKYIDLIQAKSKQNTRQQNKEKFIVKKYHEGWTLASAVSFSALAFKSISLTHKNSPVFAVISRILTMSYLLKELREKKGAYGGFAKFNPQGEVFGMGSYRDPHIFSTIKIFEGAYEYINKNNFSDVDIKEAILSIVSEIDKPDTPVMVAKNAFKRQLIALSDQDRLSFKKRLLKVTSDDVSAVASKYFRFKWSDLSVIFIGSEAKLRKANKRLGKKKLKIKKI